MTQLQKLRFASTYLPDRTQETLNKICLLKIWPLKMFLRQLPGMLQLQVTFVFSLLIRSPNTWLLSRGTRGHFSIASKSFYFIASMTPLRKKTCFLQFFQMFRGFLPCSFFINRGLLLFAQYKGEVESSSRRIVVIIVIYLRSAPRLKSIASFNP